MKKVLSIIICLTLVFVGGFAFAACGKTDVTTVNSFKELQTAISNGGNIKLDAGIECSSPLTITKNTVIDLNGNRITEKVAYAFTTKGAESNVIALFNVKGATLTVKDGSKEVGSITTDDVYTFNVLAGGVLNLEAGKFEITGTEAEKAVDTIAQVAEGTINVKGGEYKIAIANKKYMLNIIDANAKAKTGKIVVSGGKFYGYDPSNVTSEPAAANITSFVAEGYKSTNASGVYTVEPNKAE